MTVIKIQPAAKPESKWRPYPFSIEPDGTVQRQDFWEGDPAALVGFQRHLDVHHVDLHRASWWDAPQQAVGMYPVFVDSRGRMAVHLGAIEEITVLDGTETWGRVYDSEVPR